MSSRKDIDSEVSKLAMIFDKKNSAFYEAERELEEAVLADAGTSAISYFQKKFDFAKAQYFSAANELNRATSKRADIYKIGKARKIPNKTIDIRLL